MVGGNGSSSKKKLGAIGKNWIEGHEYVDLGLKNGTESDATAAAVFVLSLNEYRRGSRNDVETDLFFCFY